MHAVAPAGGQELRPDGGPIDGFTATPFELLAVIGGENGGRPGNLGAGEEKSHGLRA